MWIYYFLNELSTVWKPSKKSIAWIINHGCGYHGWWCAAFDKPGSLNAVRSNTQSCFLASSSKKSMSLAIVIKIYSPITRQCNVLGKFTRLQICIGVPACLLSVKTLFFALMNDFSLLMCRFKKSDIHLLTLCCMQQHEKLVSCGVMFQDASVTDIW